MKNALKNIGAMVFIFFVIVMIANPSSNSEKEVVRKNLKNENEKQQEEKNIDKPSDFSKTDLTTKKLTNESDTEINKNTLSQPLEVYISYLNEMEPLLDDIKTSSQELEDIAKDMATRPLTKLERLLVQTITVVHKKGYDEVLTITPPTELKDAHEIYVVAIKLFRDGVIGFEKVAIDGDASAIASATDNIWEANNKLIKANALIDKFTETYLD